VSVSTSYLTIAGQMVLMGSGIGLTSSPATESIMGAVPSAKAGVGSAVNDATRILGATLGVAVVGSVYASLYASRVTSALTGHIPGAVTSIAQRSVGEAYGAAAELDASGHTGLAGNLRAAASTAFFAGFATACLVAAGVAAVGAILAAGLLPAQPPRPTGEADADEAAPER
jgi:hypothetical protein